ncbi:Solute carrier family 35 member G1 [Holothuria leucospilota]|uniref:Solute carrier family 35 member G1 n=1 Tax=Holothuria leucospilota TaxID=206669 RepID=A0A9Q1C5L4_HOLLE|nr:Solute carrier family 35 member G1 [Holothuria leucospilota]
MYFALYSISAGVVNTIVMGAPVFVGVLAWVILREAFYCCDVILMTINFAGLLLIVQPPFLFPSESMDHSKKMELLGVVAAFASMILTALSSICLRLLGLMNVNTTKIVLYLSLCAVILSAGMGAFTQRWSIPPCGRIRYLLVGIGLMSYLYHCLLSYAFATTEKSYFVSVMSSIQVPLTIIMELTILGVTPDWLSGIGIFLVICTACGVVHRERGVEERDQGQAIEREEAHMRLEIEADKQDSPED